MSIRVIVEVLDHWQDVGLTAGERNDLIVVAENVNDATRETVGPVHEGYVLRRAGKSAAGWKNALGKLMAKKALEYAVRNGREMRGRPGQHAVYRIPILCPDPPHDGLKGMCTRPERVTSQVTHYEDGTLGTGHPSGDPIARTGHLSDANGSPERCERVTSQVTPTPLSPHNPLSLAERVVRDANVVADEERETFINWITEKHQPRGPAWWRTVAKNGDLSALAAEWRARQATTDDSPSASPLGCERCDDGYYDTGNGWAPCPHCNRNAA
ncbi:MULTISPECIES: hypothetical protein [unclassified Streptomyces]|uniref:hypothetical protein n=1 Tax=unclassified Streptomyces TaxID=2593676 RepID=UPI00093D28C2|nr:hypothetical protein [Streptomyces sp. CB01883]OKJ87264.1 hypothetical protein AMK32_08470 [Streptomyces sp. CB01883]